MKNLFNFGGQAKEQEQEQMQDLQGNYDFVETPEIFREFKEPSGPAEETNLLKIHLNKAAAEEPKGGMRIYPSPRSGYQVSFKGAESGDEIDVGEYEPLEMDLSDAEAGGHPDADAGEYESLEMDLSGQEEYASGMETAGAEDVGTGAVEAMSMNVVELDLNGDGIADALGMDLDGNGIMDSIAVDLSGDGRVDTVFSDLDGDGVYETVRQDLDGDGVEDVMHMDLDGDGIADITIEL